MHGMPAAAAAAAAPAAAVAAAATAAPAARAATVKQNLLYYPLTLSVDCIITKNILKLIIFL